MTEDIIALNIKQLVKCLQEMALPANEQMTLYPDFVDVIYELADNYGNWSNWALHNDQLLLTEEQRSQLQALDQLLSSWSNEENEALWTDQALATSAEWQDVRRRARELLSTPFQYNQ